MIPQSAGFFLSLLLSFLFLLAPASAAPAYKFASSTLRFGDFDLSYMVVGDLNGDGSPDVIATGVFSQSVYVFLSKGDGTFGDKIVRSLTGYPFPVAVADLNKDGKLDLIIGVAELDDSENTHGSVQLFLGNGDGTFAAPKKYLTPAFPVALTVADTDRDGKLDVIVEESSSVTKFDLEQLEKVSSIGIQVFAGDGAGNLIPTTARFLGYSGGLRIVAADFNGDQIPDIAMPILVDGNMMVALGKGDRTFGDFSFYGGVRQADFNGLQLAAADLNQDGKMDLVMTTGRNGKVLIYEGKGDGTFATARTVLQNDASGLAIADFDGDGTLDLGVATSASFYNLSGVIADKDSVVILTDGGVGTFPDPSVQVGTATIPLILEAADLNRDGVPDLIAMNVFSGNIRVLINQTPQILRVSTSAAGFKELAPESNASLYGSSLASGTFPPPDDFTRPTTLGGISVEVQDSTGTKRLSPLSYVLSRQINFVVPAGTAPGTAKITVLGAPGGSQTVNATIAAFSPGLFAANGNGQGVAAATAIRVDAQNTVTNVPVFTCQVGGCVTAPIALDAKSTVYVTLYGSGLRGPTGVQTGLASVKVGGVIVPVLYAGTQTQYAGLDQVNISLPYNQLAGKGEVDVVLTAGGKVSNTVKLNMQ